MLSAMGGQFSWQSELASAKMAVVRRVTRMAILIILLNCWTLDLLLLRLEDEFN